MQEDKEQIFDAVDTVLMCLPVFSGMLKTMRIQSNNMSKAATGGFTNATDAADYLVKKGLPFRDAHEVIGKIVSYCIEKGIGISDVKLEQLKSFSPLFEQDIYDAISLSTCVNARKTKGGTATEMVLNEIKSAKKFIEN